MLGIRIHTFLSAKRVLIITYYKSSWEARLVKAVGLSLSHTSSSIGEDWRGGLSPQLSKIKIKNKK